MPGISVGVEMLMLEAGVSAADAWNVGRRRREQKARITFI
jgi:hypothetical protein